VVPAPVRLKPAGLELRDPRVEPMFEEILRFWLDRRYRGFRIDVAHGLFKDPTLADVTATLTQPALGLLSPPRGAARLP